MADELNNPLSDEEEEWYLQPGVGRSKREECLKEGDDGSPEDHGSSTVTVSVAQRQA